MFAVERFIRFVIFAAAAYGVWRFKYDRGRHPAGVQQRPARHPHPVPGPRLQRRPFQADRADPALVHAGRAHAHLAGHRAGRSTALIELTEGVGLWLGQRWGEYFAMVATSVFLPYEIYDLTVKITWLRVGALVVNLLLVVYLVWSKRLFGVRGGKQAYEARLRPVLHRGGAGRPATAKPVEQPTPEERRVPARPCRRRARRCTASIPRPVARGSASAASAAATRRVTVTPAPGTAAPRAPGGGPRRAGRGRAWRRSS